MGGGRGGGFFAGTDGWRASEAFARGTLVAAAAQNTATDAGGGSGGMLDALRPWWFYPYGHPEKTKKIKMMQEALKPRAERLAKGVMAHPSLLQESIKLGGKFIKKKSLDTDVIPAKKVK